MITVVKLRLPLVHMKSQNYCEHVQYIIDTGTWVIIASCVCYNFFIRKVKMAEYVQNGTCQIQ